MASLFSYATLAPLGGAAPAAPAARRLPSPPPSAAPALDDVLGGACVSDNEDGDEPPGPPPGSPPREEGAAAAARPPRVPWEVPPPALRSHLVRLHTELVSFHRVMAPTPAEDAGRGAAVARVAAAVAALWPRAEVAVFGSTATRLHLPTSDVDAVILGAPPVPPGGDAAGRLKLVAAALLARKLARGVQLIARARVPLVKFTDAESGLLFDVSFDVGGGPAAARRAARRLTGMPAARPMLAFLKTVLHQRSLNEVYSGGLGSHALLVMVLAFLGAHPSRRPRGTPSRGAPPPPAPLEPNLGALLLDFCDLFGRRLDATAAGVCAGAGGAFYPKAAAGHARPDRPWALAVRDPDDAGNDLTAGSFHVAKVRSALASVGAALAAPAASPGESLLARVVRLDERMAARGGGGGGEGGGGGARARSSPRARPKAATTTSTTTTGKRKRERDAAFDDGPWASGGVGAPRGGRGRGRGTPPPAVRHIRFDD